VVMIKFPGAPPGTVWEVAHDGAGFGPDYATLSTRTVIANGYHYSLRRDGGWPYAPELEVHAIDVAGNMVDSPFVLVPADATAPTVSNVRPSSGTIAADMPVSMDVQDTSSAIRQILLLVKYVGNPPGLAWEVAYDGTAFAPNYAALSQRTAIANGNRFRLRRRGGWAATPVVVVHAVDYSGNENP